MHRYLTPLSIFTLAGVLFFNGLNKPAAAQESHKPPVCEAPGGFTGNQVREKFAGALGAYLDEGRTHFIVLPVPGGAFWFCTW